MEREKEREKEKEEENLVCVKFICSKITTTTPK